MGRIKNAELIAALQQFPPDMDVVVAFAGGGDVSVEKRDLFNDYANTGETVVAMFNSNGGCFGYDHMTEEQYQRDCMAFLDALYDEYRPRCELYRNGRRFTSIHGDYRIYSDFGGLSDTCYGKAYSPQFIERMVADGLLKKYKQPYSRDGVRITPKGKEYFETQKVKL